MKIVSSVACARLPRPLIRPWAGLFGCILAVLCGISQAATPALVDTVRVDKHRWRQSVPLYGTLTSPRDAELTPRVAGLVESVDVDAGDHVTIGDTLIRLDRTLEALNLDTLEAAAAEAEAQLAEARRLRREAGRLAERGAISTTELEARRSRVAVRAAALKRLRADAARQRERLDRHAVVAPFDGVVRARHVEPGEYVSQTTPVVALVSTERLRMDVAAPQQYYAWIKPGMTVRIRPEALAGRTIEAHVNVTVGASDPRARSFLVRVFVPNDNGTLAPGMSATVWFDIETAERVVVAPRDALVRVPGGGTRIWVVEDDEAGGLRAIKRQVTLGRGANGTVEIRSGLMAGEQIVVRGNESLENDQPVRVRQAKDAAGAAAKADADSAGASVAAPRRVLRLSNRYGN